MLNINLLMNFKKLMEKLLLNFQLIIILMSCVKLDGAINMIKCGNGVKQNQKINNSIVLLFNNYL